MYPLTKSEKDMGWWKQGQRDAMLLTLKMEKEGHKPRNAAGKCKGADSFLEPPEQNAALLAPWF